MGWLTKAWRWLVLNWKFDACSFCGRMNVPKDTQFIPRCQECDGVGKE